MADMPASTKRKSRFATSCKMKRDGQKLVVVTAYDVLFARLVDAAGVDIVLVGDSLGNVVAGFDSTLPVTLDQMIYHGAAVRRGVKRALLVVDMPFLSYQASEESAILNCGRVLQQTGADAVKVEGGTDEMVQHSRKAHAHRHSDRCAPWIHSAIRANYRHASAGTGRGGRDSAWSIRRVRWKKRVRLRSFSS